MMHRRGLAFLVLAAVMAIWLLLPSTGLWAVPDTDPLGQTVPTATNTRRPRPPKEPTDTPEPPPIEPTATPTSTPEPTATPTETPTSTPWPTVASPTRTGSPTPSPTGIPFAPAAEGALEFGDAPDPGFPSLLASDGARHTFIQFEWLGEGASAEQDSEQVDQDPDDDGVGVAPFEPCTLVDVDVMVTVLDREDPEHAYDAEHVLYLNVLVDWDGDGSWGGEVSCPQGWAAYEWPVRNLPVDVSSWPQDATSSVVHLQLAVGPLVREAWARFTLTYGEVISGEDWDGRGAFTFGETEDYLLTQSGFAMTAAPVEPPSATAPTPTPTPAPASWWRVPPCFGAGLSVGGALGVVWAGRKRRNRRLLLGALLVLVMLLIGGAAYYGLPLVSLALGGQRGPSSMPPTPIERLIPTSTAKGEETSRLSSAAPQVDVTPAARVVPMAPKATATAESRPQFAIATPLSSSIAARDRFGFGAASSPVDLSDVGQLQAGWYLNWRSEANPYRPQGMEFAQMIRVRGNSYTPNGQDLERVISNNPGSLWLIGNEPDVIWQDNTAPADYARVYHDVHSLLKSKDPTCQVAIGGVSQATPLRLQYLDMILQAYWGLYGKMIPVDVWNVHAFVLREERGSWGVDIPPGVSAGRGRLYEIEDHDDVDIFKEQIVAFRGWMRDKGERDKPLIISEYGVLMPEEYGFPYERVKDFMYASFDFLLTARDDFLGYPADDNRLVQRWAWYSLGDTVYPTGNLFDPDTGQITPLGLAYGSYVSSH